MGGGFDNSYQGLVSAFVHRGSAEDYYNLGCLLHEQKRWGAAAGCFARVVERDPGNYRGWSNYGWNLHLSGRAEDGEEALRRAVSIAPEEGTPRALLCQVYLTLGESVEAERQGRLGVKFEPNLAINHVSHSFALMRCGMWAEGWSAYEHRFSYKLPEFLTRPMRLWRGERVKHLYIEFEQGSGDSLMAMRWVPLACERAERVTMYVQGPLYALVSVQDWPENLTVLPLPQMTFPADVDAWCPSLSLPVALDRPEPFWDGPYVSVMTGAHWPEGRKQVGIVWGGSGEHEQAHHRDCPLAYWLRLAEIPNVDLHSLQVGDAQKQIGDLGAWGLVADRSAELTNYLDTAIIVSGLDLVVTVDTSVAHLAGAMGKPVWMLVNQRGADFRYEGASDGRDWYKSLVQFKRGLHEQWSDVMARVATALANKC